MTTSVATPHAEVFDTVVPVDLSRIFSRWGPIPGVARTEILTGTAAWDEVGMSRRVVLTDGSSIEEEITAHEPPHYFAYELRKFDPPLSYLLTAARGEWVFVPVGDRTVVKWTYAFTPRAGVLTPAVSLFATYAYRNYMRSALDAIESMLAESDG